MEPPKRYYTATQIHSIISVAHGILHPTFTADDIELKFKLTPKHLFKIWAEGNKQKVKAFKNLCYLFEESWQRFPMWQTGTVVLMERAVFPIVVLFRRLQVDPTYASNLFFTKTANKAKFLDVCMDLFNEFLTEKTDPINESVVRELFDEEFYRLADTFTIMRSLGWSWQFKRFRHFSRLPLKLKKAIFNRLKLPKVSNNNYWGALRMNRLNKSHLNDNPNYHLVELRLVDRFFHSLVQEQLINTDNQLNFDSRWHIRFQNGVVVINQVLADTSIQRLKFNLNEFKKLCSMTKTTELSVSFSVKNNFDDFLGILNSLVEKVPAKDSEHWPRSASALLDSQDYKFVIQLGGRVSRKNLNSIAKCFKFGFSTLIQNIGTRQEDFVSPNTLHGSKRNQRFERVFFVKGK